MPTIGDAIFVALISIVFSLIASIPFIFILFMWGSNFGVALLCGIAIGFIGMVVFTYFLLNAQEKATEDVKHSQPISTEAFEEKYREEIERRKHRKEDVNNKD